MHKSAEESRDVMNTRSACAALFLMAASADALAQDFEIYRQFVGSLGGPSEKMTVATDWANVYGTDNGGDFGRGEIFRLVPDGMAASGSNACIHSTDPTASSPSASSRDPTAGSTARRSAEARSGVERCTRTIRTGLVVFHNFPVHPFTGSTIPPASSRPRTATCTARPSSVGRWLRNDLPCHAAGRVHQPPRFHGPKAPGPSARSSSPPTAFSTGPRRSGEPPVSAVDRPVPVTAGTARSSERIFRATSRRFTASCPPSAGWHGAI